MPSIRIETPRVFYDYRAKYESDRTEYHCPGTTDAETEALYADLAIAAFNELGCSGWGRVDFMTGDDGRPQVLEATYGSGHDEPQPCADGGEQGGHRFCRALLAHSGNKRRPGNSIQTAGGGCQ